MVSLDKKIISSDIKMNASNFTIESLQFNLHASDFIGKILTVIT
jgi:hypothetical protein